MQNLSALAAALARGESSRALVEQCLARIADPAGEGKRTVLKVHEDAARAAADAVDQRRKKGEALPPFAGIPISLKDLFDVKGDVTTAGSVALKDAPPAAADATVVAHLKAAGFISIGRTNMTEFAFSGLGLNPHYGTPANPYDRASARIPGGSSSGAAISVTDGMAAAGLGTDTGGSCRIPAALCGLVGYKPTARRISAAGVFPLSTTLDSIGPIAPTVECCAIIDAIIAGEPLAPLSPRPLKGLRLAIPQTVVLGGMDQNVSADFARAAARLSAAGAHITERAVPEIADIGAINANGGPITAEAYAVHADLIAAKGELYDPRVLSRMLRGKDQSAADYIKALRARAALTARFDATTAPYDALILPTVPVIAPRIADLTDDEHYRVTNMLMLRNPSIANFFDRCAISLPMHLPGAAPTGLMLIAPHGKDADLFAIAAGVEVLFASA